MKENFENFAENSLPFEMLLPASGSVDISSHDFQLNSILPIPPTVGKHRDAADTSVFFLAFFYYSSIYCNWWDFGGMSSVYIEIGGIHRTSFRPKPRPTTPHDSGAMIKLLSQKEKS